MIKISKKIMILSLVVRLPLIDDYVGNAVERGDELAIAERQRLEATERLK